MSATTLRYYGTQEEMRLGDVIRIRRWFHRDRHAVVCYLPGVSPMHPELEFGDIKLWAYRTAVGTIESLPYLPVQSPCAPKHITLVERGRTKGLSPTEPLHPRHPRATQAAAPLSHGFPVRRAS